MADAQAKTYKFVKEVGGKYYQKYVPWQLRQGILTIYTKGMYYYKKAYKQVSFKCRRTNNDVLYFSLLLQDLQTTSLLRKCSITPWISEVGFWSLVMCVHIHHCTVTPLPRWTSGPLRLSLSLALVRRAAAAARERAGGSATARPGIRERTSMKCSIVHVHGVSGEKNDRGIYNKPKPVCADILCYV